jgi:hypothetical protein
MKMMDLKMALIARGGISLNDLFGRCGKVMRRSLGVADQLAHRAGRDKFADIPTTKGVPNNGFETISPT